LADLLADLLAFLLATSLLEKEIPPDQEMELFVDSVVGANSQSSRIGPLGLGYVLDAKVHYQSPHGSQPSG
jgi:hypothetical protein